MQRSLQQKENGGDSLELGVALSVYLASSQSDGVTGKLISAKWDPWQDFAKHQNDLASTDIYTLRRIVPNERDMDWGDK